jgi:hypothetical protein
LYIMINSVTAGIARALTWSGTGYRGNGITLPSSTTSAAAAKATYIEFRYVTAGAINKWCLAVLVTGM